MYLTLSWIIWLSPKVVSMLMLMLIQIQEVCRPVTWVDFQNLVSEILFSHWLVDNKRGNPYEVTNE